MYTGFLIYGRVLIYQLSPHPTFCTQPCATKGDPAGPDEVHQDSHLFDKLYAGGFGRVTTCVISQFLDVSCFR